MSDATFRRWLDGFSTSILRPGRSRGLDIHAKSGQHQETTIPSYPGCHFAARHNRAWDAADLVMEVVSDDPKDRQRDYEQKMLDYAEAKVAEYWIVDYERRTVAVHRLEGDRYIPRGEFRPGEQATSVLLNGITVDVAALFAAADEIPE